MTMDRSAPGPSQRTKRRAPTRRDTDQRKGASAGRRVLGPVAGPINLTLLVLQDPEIDHRFRCVVGVAGLDRPLPPDPSTVRIQIFFGVTKLVHNGGIHGFSGVNDEKFAGFEQQASPVGVQARSHTRAVSSSLVVMAIGWPPTSVHATASTEPVWPSRVP
jgi:hypothetical protein